MIAETHSWMRATQFLFGTVAIVVLLSTSQYEAFAKDPFYKGKTITIVRGGRPGGTGELQARTIVPFLKKHIPGNPTIVMLHMPGAGGRSAANHVYKTRRPETTIGSIGGGLLVGPILGLPGVKYDIDKFIYLGSTESGNPYMFYTRKDLGLDSLEKLQAHSDLRIGAHSVGHPIYYSARLIAYLLNLKNPKAVTGYSGREIDLALLRGEVDARTNNAVTLLRRNPDWVEKDQIDIHAAVDVPKGNFHPRFKDVPSVEKFAKTDLDRKTLELFRALLYPRWPFVLSPNTPKENVEILETAMRKTLNDPEFQKHFKKLMGNDATPLMSEEMRQGIKAIPRDPEVLALFKKLAGPGPVPPRE